MSVIVLPDAELLVISFLRGNSTLTPYLVGGKVGTYLRAERPFVQVNRIGGRPDGYGEDNPQLQIAVWHTDDEKASELARMIVAALPSIISDTVRGWGILLGPFSQPDQDNHRYLMTVELLTYGTEE